MPRRPLPRSDSDSDNEVSVPIDSENTLITRIEKVVQGRKVLKVTAIHSILCLLNMYPCGGHEGARLTVGSDTEEVVVDFRCGSVDICRVMRHYLGPEGVEDHFATYTYLAVKQNTAELGG